MLHRSSRTQASTAECTSARILTRAWRDHEILCGHGCDEIVPLPLILKESVEAATVVPLLRVSERIVNRIFPQVAEQFVAVFVAVPVLPDVERER